MPLDMSQFFTGNYIRAEELKEGVIYEDTIVNVDVRTMRGESQPVIWFAGERGIVLNYTRWRVMVDGYGPDGHAWIGQVVRYRREPTTFEGRPTATIEIIPPDSNAK
jgi:hypothetical protein